MPLPRHLESKFEYNLKTVHVYTPSMGEWDERDCLVTLG